MVRVKINNIEFLVNSNLSVLEACQFVGVHIPRFCYHETLSIAGNCRMCLVEIEKSPKPVASCALPLSNNLSIFTDSPLVKKARENILESLLLNHPLDCPICDQGGECDLQDQTKIFGGDYSRYYFNKRVVESKPYGTLIKTIMTRCIHCTRCVRFSEEIAGTSSFGTFNRGKNTEIGPYVLNTFDSEISGNVVDLCPVGALTFKPYAFKARPWELKYYESVDCTSSLCTPILVNVKESDIVRIQPKTDSQLSNSLISDKIRFVYDSVKKNRIQQVFKKNQSNGFSVESWNTFYNKINVLLKEKKNITFLVNENLDFESAELLKSFESKNIKFLNTSSFSLHYKNTYNQLFHGNTESIYKKIKTCFILSTNLKTETTLLNTKLRLKYNKNSFSTISIGSFYKSNYPIKFINLSTQNIINLFEGRFLNSSKILESSNVLLVVGNAFKNKTTASLNLISLFKKVCPTGLIIDNQIYPNSVGFNFLGVNGLINKVLKSTDFFFCINLEDTTRIRKLLLNQNFFWLNTHGSGLAINANFIIPTLTFLEVENTYLNLDGIKKKSQKVLPSLKDSQSVIHILKTIENLIQINNKSFVTLSSINYLSKINNNSQLKFKPLLSYKDDKLDYVFNYPNKNIIENFYCDSTITKNSVILSKRAQEQQKSTHNTF
jgi:NADH-quinone oxidoreductase subunit G